MLSSLASRLAPGAFRAATALAAQSSYFSGIQLSNSLLGALRASDSVPPSTAVSAPARFSSSDAAPNTPSNPSSASPSASPSAASDSATSAPTGASLDPASTSFSPRHPEPSPASPPRHASRRDAASSSSSPSTETVWPSSHDDSFGVQRNWFHALYSQLNVVHRTGMVPHMKGRQKEVFAAVEAEFERLWEAHIKGRELQGTAHRGMLLCCLAVATHKVLRYEAGDEELVKEIIRTNLGGMAVRIMSRLHRARLWVLMRLLAEDPYKQAVRFLPTLQDDMSGLVPGQVSGGEAEATWSAPSCAFHGVLAAEGATELLPEFCCQYAMQWLEDFAPYGVRVGLEKSLGFEDDCCVIRISRPGGAPAAPGAETAAAAAAEAEAQQLQQQPGQRGAGGASAGAPEPAAQPQGEQQPRSP